MPVNSAPRRDSWPPTILRVDDDVYDAAAVDANPFEYFLTTPDHLDDIYDVDELGAGIESDSKPRTEIRQVSPSSLQRETMDDEDDEEYIQHPSLLPTSLKDLTAMLGRDMVLRPRPTTPPKTQPAGAPRGRPQIRAAPLPQTYSGRGRGRGQTRSLPTRRPHAWRVPSPDVYSIPEEEDEVEVKEEVKEEETVASPAKPSKKVRWSF